MDFLFKNNSIKSTVILAGIMIVFFISATFLVNVLVTLLPVAIVGWLLYRIFNALRACFRKDKRVQRADVYKADTVTISDNFEEELSNRTVIDVEYTEV